MSEVRVVVCGCDDLTEVVIEATKSELEFLNKLALLVNEASTYGCMPSMSIDDKYIKEDLEGEDNE